MSKNYSNGYFFTDKFLGMCGHISNISVFKVDYQSASSFPYSCYIMPLRIISALSSFGKALNDISTLHAVGLYWVPRHAGVRGNKIADELARDGCLTKFVGPELALGVSRQDTRKIRH